MKMSIGTVLVALSVAVLYSCKEKPVDQPAPEVNYVEIQVHPVFGASTLNIDSIYTTQEGYKVKFTDIKFYFSKLGSSTTNLSDALLFDYKNKGVSMGKVQENVNNFPSLSCNLGVHGDYNNSDPSAFPNESALNIANANDMHWSWALGYIFAKIEGKADTIVDATINCDHNIVFHVGKSELLRSKTFQGINWNTIGNTSTFKLKLDMEKFLVNGSSIIDLKNEHTTHTAPGEEALSLKVMDNFSAAISVY